MDYAGEIHPSMWVPSARMVTVVNGALREESEKLNPMGWQILDDRNLPCPRSPSYLSKVVGGTMVEQVGIDQVDEGRPLNRRWGCCTVTAG